MASFHPYAAIKAKISELAPGIPVVDDELVDDMLEQGTTIFIGLADDFSEETTESVGTPTENWMREEGSILATIYGPAKDMDFQVIRQTADTVRDVVRYQTLDSDGNVVLVKNAQPPERGDVNNGLWSSMAVVIDFTFRYVKATTP